MLDIRVFSSLDFALNLTRQEYNAAFAIKLSEEAGPIFLIFSELSIVGKNSLTS